MSINFLTWTRYRLVRFPHLRLPIFWKLRFVCSKSWHGRDTGGCRRGLTRGRRWGGGGRGSAPPSTGSARSRWCCPESWTRWDDSRRKDLKFVNIVNNLSHWGSGSGGRISWDWNSTFSGNRQINHEVKIPKNDSISWSALFSWDWNCLIVQKKHY